MTTKTDPTSDLLDGDNDHASLFARGLDTETGEQSELDDFLSDWRSEIDDEESLAFNPYNDLLEPRVREGSEENSITAGSGWSYDSVSIQDRAGRTAETSSASKLVLLNINDEIYGFRLLHELGSGSFAKVFLAKQGDLADREVVLKISAIEGTEPQTLAQLQHTHVVPIYSVHEDAHFGLRAVCMPYFGGASLNKVLKQVWAGTTVPATGKSLMDALDRVSGPQPAVRATSRGEDAAAQAVSDVDHGEAAQTARTTLANLPYVQAAAWIVARLAEGLQHSHERNVIHRDIKPSNILLSSEGQPLLLDFNVSQALDCDPDEATVGGTIAYMSPEQLRSMRDRSAKSSALVNRRSDIYSLGLVLYEMLTGASPFVETLGAATESKRLKARIEQRELPVPSLKSRSRLDIPWGLESIVRKSLAPLPADRYASAGQLADDLNRFLQDLPLKYSPELSRVEQIRKWGRRHPRLTTACYVMLVAAMLIIPGALILQFTQDDLAAKNRQLLDADAGQRARLFQGDAQSALCLIKTSIADDDVMLSEESLRQGIESTKAVLALYRITTYSDWQDDVYWQRLESQERASLSETARELLLELASAHVRTERDNQAAAGRAALDLINIAARIRHLAPSRALELDRARYLLLVGREPEAQRALAAAEKIPVVTAHDNYMLAAAHTRNRTTTDYREAVQLLTKSIEMSPNHYWSVFQRALCYQELGEKWLAVSDLGRCIGLWPQSSWAHFNQGYLLYLQGKKLEAINAYTMAIRNSPKLRSAYFNRALAHLELQNFEDALVDFKKVQDLGRDDAVLDAARAMALEGMGQHAEADELFNRVLQLAKKSSDVNTHRFSSAYAFAVAHRAPNISRKAFEEIVRVNPEHAQAHYGLGMLKMNEQDLAGAVRCFDRALEAETTFIEPLRYRAIALARQGDYQQALGDTRACVEREPSNPDSLYAAACVAALVARKLQPENFKDSALELLKSAIEFGADPARARTDPDFSVLRGDPDFVELTGSDVEEE